MLRQTPLYGALKKYIEEQGMRLHMPGHIGGKNGLPAELEAAAGLDLTEVPGLDDLHLPRGIIAQARDLLSQACGAAESFFLVNGATSGIQALLMSFSESDQVIIPRNAHRSFYGGMVLSGVTPIYLPCEIEPELGIAVGVRAEEIEDLLYLHGDAEAIFIASPSYYGTCCDIDSIAAVVRRWGKMLLVDEAHGSHFPFHPLYPTPALKAGAAAAVNGLHKTWPVLTPGACLHLGDGFSNYDRLRSAYHILTTTSPAYPLLASIDWARDFMQHEGYNYLDRALEYSREFKSRLNQIKGIRCYGEELLNIAGVKAVDPLKILIGVQGLSLTGYQLGKLLRVQYGIQVEIEDQNLILAMFSLLHERDEWERFYLALQDVAGRYSSAGIKQNQVCLPPAPPMILSPRQAFKAAAQKVPLADSRNRVAGEMVVAYPPGIPCLVPGELISEEVYDYLQYLKKTGAHIQGLEEPELEHIKVIM